MMYKWTRPLLFLGTFLATLIVLFISLYSYFYAIHQKRWLMILVQEKIVGVPLVIYLILIALAVSTVVVLMVYFIRRAQYGKIEEKVRLLSSGNYDNSIFLTPIYSFEEESYISNIDSDLDAIRIKMMDMSKELQQLSSRPQLVAGETKEEILQEERHRLARELHDSVSQQLFAATMMISALQESAVKTNQPEAAQKQLNMVGDIINTSQSEMRALLLHLRPITLEGKSLRAGIEQLLKELQSKIQIQLKWEVEDVHLASMMEDNLFRIVQELLSNTLRHAKANSLEVYLRKMDNLVLLRMVDDGVGFDVDKTRVGSYGLNNIQERVIGMGGTCKIISFIGKGTSVEIRIPDLKEREVND